MWGMGEQLADLVWPLLLPSSRAFLPQAPSTTQLLTTSYIILPFFPAGPRLLFGHHAAHGLQHDEGQGAAGGVRRMGGAARRHAVRFGGWGQAWGVGWGLGAGVEGGVAAGLPDCSSSHNPSKLLLRERLSRLLPGRSCCMSRVLSFSHPRCLPPLLLSPLCLPPAGSCFPTPCASMPRTAPSTITPSCSRGSATASLSSPCGYPFSLQPACACPLRVLAPLLMLAAGPCGCPVPAALGQLVPDCDPGPLGHQWCFLAAFLPALHAAAGAGVANAPTLLNRCTALYCPLCIAACRQGKTDFRSSATITRKHNAEVKAAQRAEREQLRAQARCPGSLSVACSAGIERTSLLPRWCGGGWWEVAGVGWERDCRLAAPACCCALPSWTSSFPGRRACHRSPRLPHFKPL